MAGDRMPWFKWWDGTAADMKFRMVAEDCKLPVACIVGAWAYVLEHASRSVDRGSIADIDYELMSYTLQIPDCETVCNAMKRRKLLHETGQITKWEDRQGKREKTEPSGASTKRVQELRARQKAEREANQNKGLQPPAAAPSDKPGDVTGETDVTDGNGEKRPKKKNREEVDKDPKTLTPSSSGDDGRKPFDQFWDAYPRKVGKQDAQKAWTKIKVDTVLLALILKAIENQQAGADWLRDDGQYIPHPATWLRGGRWLDEVRPYVAPPVKLPAGWWETADSIKAAGLMLDPPLTPNNGEGQKAFAWRIRVALGEVDMPQADPLRSHTTLPPPGKPWMPPLPPAPPPGVQLTEDQLEARKQEMREQLAKLKQTGNLALAGLAAANAVDKAA